MSKAESHWSAEEDAVLLATLTLTLAEVAALLPGRTPAAISGHRSRLAKKQGRQLLRNGSPLRIGRRPLIAKTCPECGFLLSAKWYVRRNDGQWQKLCTRCHNTTHAVPRKKRTPEAELEAQRNRKRVEAAVNAGATRSWFPWLESDMSIISDPELTIAEKASLTRRTFGATKDKCRQMGFKSKRSNGLGDPAKDPWRITDQNAA